MIRLFVTVGAVLLLAVTGTSGQALFAGKKSSSYGGFVSYSHVTGGNAYGFDVAYSPVNKVEIGAGLNRLTGGDPDAIVVGPYVNIIPINENDGKIPLSLCLGASIGLRMTDGGGRGASANKNVTTFGGTLHKNLFLTDALLFQPFAGFGTQKVENYDSETGPLLGMSFLLKTSAVGGFVISNSYGFFDKSTTVSVSVGFVGVSGRFGSKK